MSQISMQAFYARLQRAFAGPDERLQDLARLSRLSATRIAAMTSAMAWDNWSVDTAA